ncbi:MAG: NAD-dependent epimerase/dehydratase family protein [Acidimicrobiia bacterium]
MDERTVTEGIPALGRCFVTGGAGFIGSHLVDRLLDEGADVTVYDNLSSGRHARIEHNLGRKGFRFVQADLLDLDGLTRALSGHDSVWHLGANTDIPGGSKDVELDIRNCTLATHNVLKAMQVRGTQRLVFASTSAIYGDPSVFPAPEDAGPLHPISLYGAAKLACEALISAYCHLFGLQAWMFRFANVVGARMGHGVIYDFIQKFKRDPTELEIWGDGQQQKPYFLVEDCIEGIFCAYLNTNEWCNVFNLGSTTLTKVDRIAETISDEMNLSEVRIRYTGGRRGFPGDVPELLLDVSKMNRLGWQASCTSDEAVRIATRRLLGKEAGIKAQ